MARKYEMKRRAELVAETRRRITEAAVELHGTVGPARTSISAVAERAGVERLTVYRHFPDEFALFKACTGHWLAQNPFPETTAWRSIEDPEARVRVALGELYAWYRRTEPMMSNFLRDAPLVPALANRQGEWAEYIDGAQAMLARGFGVRGRRRKHLLAAIAHALDLHTWASLARKELDDDEVAELMTRFVRTAAA